MAWSDFFKIFTYSFESDPISRKKNLQDLSGAGITQPDGIPDLRSGDNSWNGSIQLRDSNEFVDLNSNINRQSRYREYQRLRMIPEIEWAMTVFADETCLAGETKVSTLFDGLVEIKTLAETKKEPFLVYSWDFEKNDYTLGWAHDPRVVKTAKTVRITLDDGTSFRVTPEHKILLRTSEWKMAGDLKFGDELMPFYRIRPDPELTQNKIKQFPRIFTFQDGWKHERQFIDEWKLGKKEPQHEEVNRACRMLAEGLTVRETAKLMQHQWNTVESWISAEGFSTRELKWLGKRADRRKVIGVRPAEEIEVYDLSVDKHENFAGESCIFHNCQKNDKRNLFNIECKDPDIKEELEFLFFHRSMLNMNNPQKLWSEVKQLFIEGDRFWELCIDPENPKAGIVKIQSLPPDTMYRIETTRGRTVEFQQSKDGPDYSAISRMPVLKSSMTELQASRVIRFTPEQIIHMRVGDDRKEFYPYGVSILEPARGPAHQLRMMEDAMMVYRLTRAPERRVFYIDVAQLPPFKAEAFVERMKDQFRKKKVALTTGKGASAVDERWHAPAQDEDYWLPIRQNSNTRIDTLPGAQNLGEVDDVKWFRDKLFLAMGFPKNYYTTDDVQQTRISLSAQDVKFARMIERLQAHIEEGLWQVADRHMKLRGFPEEAYEDLVIQMTPPSDWREMSRAEVITNRLNNAGSLKGAMLLADYDIMVDWMKMPEEEANRKIARMKAQKLDELRLQIIAQNPQLLGVGVPGQAEPELGAQAGGPNPMLSPDQGQQPPDQGQQPPDQGAALQGQGEDQDQGLPQTSPGGALPEPTASDLRKYDLQVQNYSSEEDHEEIDYSLGDG